MRNLGMTAAQWKAVEAAAASSDESWPQWLRRVAADQLASNG